MKNTTLSLLFLSFFTFAYSSNATTAAKPLCLVKQQINDTLVIYAEVTREDNYAQLHTFVAALEADTTNFVRVVYNVETSEFTVEFTDQITQSSVIQLFKQEYGQIKVRN